MIKTTKYSILKLFQDRVWLAFILFTCVGLSIFVRSLVPRVYTDEFLIFDLIWLDFWSLLFVTVLLIIMTAPCNSHKKAWLLTCSLSLFGLIVASLLFAGTTWPYNAYWGDQQFRVAMIRKFMTYGIGTDFYIADLPPFYPPLYYYILSIIGHIRDVDALETLKTGSQLLLFVMPIALFLLWKRIVSPIQAFFIVLFQILWCSAGKPYPFSAPHAFLANLLFIPWWLYYIEQTSDVKRNCWFYLSGGLLGSVIFTTYFFPFFIGGVILCLQGISRLLSKYRRNVIYYQHSWKSVALVLIVLAILTAPYWLSAALSITEAGLDRSRGGWHHFGSLGIGFSFIPSSIKGLAYILSVLYLLKRSHTRVNRALLMLISASVLFYMFGTFSGAIGIPVNLIKASEFIDFLAGPIIGLTFIAFIQVVSRQRRLRLIPLIAVSAFMLLLLNQQNALGKQKTIKVAREKWVESWVAKSGEIDQYPGTVFLSGYDKLATFYPVYLFFVTNEHYAHPASQYLDRYKFLFRLQSVKDPYLFHTALRHNRYSKVDFFFPKDVKGKWEFVFGLSNYPNRWTHRKIVLDKSLVGDTSLFSLTDTENLYQLKTEVTPPEPSGSTLVGLNGIDSLEYLLLIHEIRADLDSIGRNLVDQYLRVDWSNWAFLPQSDISYKTGDSLLLQGACLVTLEDSLWLGLDLYSRQKVSGNYRFFVHAYPRDAGTAFDNYDFVPPIRTSVWQKHDLTIQSTMFPQVSEYREVSVGMFSGQGRQGRGIRFGR